MGFGEVILCMYATLASAILAGIVNMAWCKSNILEATRKPIDGGNKFFDKKRIFGDNKTWKGLIGYIFLNIVMAVLVGAIYNLCSLNRFSFVYQNHANTPLFNVWLGFLIGLAYALFELPNSFLKRRLGIKPGKSATGWKKVLFTILDQADSIFGICLVVCLFYPMTIWFYLLYVLIGSATHILLNVLLYLAGLRKNMF